MRSRGVFSWSVEYNEIILAFRDYYGLGEYSIKEMDKYLWQLGKDYFPRSY